MATDESRLFGFYETNCSRNFLSRVSGISKTHPCMPRSLVGGVVQPISRDITPQYYRGIERRSTSWPKRPVGDHGIDIDGVCGCQNCE